MSRVATKICGLKTPEAITAAVAGGARYLGFNFVPSSPRFVSPQVARDLRQAVPPEVLTVALVAKASDDTITDILETVRPDALQLHGNETPSRISAVMSRFGLPLFIARGVSTAEDVAAACDLETLAEHILLDAKAPAGQDSLGGHGATFDWTILKKRKPAKPWFLSGGLTIDNVAQAVAATNAPMIDLSSGVERLRGEKDPDLIRAFLDTVKDL